MLAAAPTSGKKTYKDAFDDYDNANDKYDDDDDFM